MKIIHISAECYPVAKVGGLADVVGALPKYQNMLGEESSVIMPYYNIAFTQQHEFESIYENTIVLGENTFNFRILKPVDFSLGFDLFLIDIPELLFKDYVYSFDDSNRFLAFQIAALDWILTLKIKPDTIHCHDHHTGLIPFMLQESFKYESLNNIPVVTTIHNAQYQGWFSHDKVNLIPEFNFKNVGLLDWDNSINPLAAAIKCAWKVTTVSPSYMEELKSAANGLEALLSNEYKKCVGILNGIDTNVWNTETDTFITKQYSISNNVAGKKANKKWLCDTFNLNINKPLFAFIGRLVHEKGSDLFPQAFDLALKDNDISILLLGSGNKETEAELEALKTKHIGNYNTHIGYDEKLSHNVYAGADFLLMPSRVEPCGLNQMYSLRYGTIPIVRSIGGLKDTIIDIENNGFGFTHKNTTVEDICKAIKRAVTFYKDEVSFKKTKTQIMNIDHSWDNSAKKYIELYKSLNN
ncbi:glycogen synthase [Lacinutrix algicola]|uniref:glycogen synthase n=1 Tax=Lacinutrix algicola TaxID=342954 RepID=UPI0006E142BE|nr:glycogen/starch synthase [Lacinutrix algicola]